MTAMVSFRAHYDKLLSVHNIVSVEVPIVRPWRDACEGRHNGFVAITLEGEAYLRSDRYEQLRKAFER